MASRTGKQKSLHIPYFDKEIETPDLPYVYKKCAVCGKVSHQGHNGRWYCDEHHPQRLCDGCDANLGRYKVGLNTLCGACIERNRQNGDTQSN